MGLVVSPSQPGVLNLNYENRTGPLQPPLQPGGTLELCRVLFGIFKARATEWTASCVFHMCALAKDFNKQVSIVPGHGGGAFQTYELINRMSLFSRELKNKPLKYY